LQLQTLSVTVGLTEVSTSKMAQETQILIDGLLTAMKGDPVAVAKLPSSAPEFTRDVSVFAIFSIIMFVFNWGTRLLLVENFAAAVLKMHRKTMREKWSQSAMEVIFYGGFTILGLYVVPKQEWVWPSVLWWKGFKEGGHEFMRSDLRCFYLLYGARYFQGLVSIFMEHKRKDFVEMFAHHAVTVVLILISFGYGWNRIGAVIMVILDPADVFLHSAKMCKYISDAMTKGQTRKASWQMGADMIFALFAIVFFVTRLVMYPYVCWSAYFETRAFFAKGLPEWVCIVLLGTLLFLQCYWFYLLVSAVVRMIRSGGVEDVRSDDEDEDEAKKAQ
jgi:ceramide synthetase